MAQFCRVLLPTAPNLLVVWLVTEDLEWGRTLSRCGLFYGLSVSETAGCSMVLHLGSGKNGSGVVGVMSRNFRRGTEKSDENLWIYQVPAEIRTGKPPNGSAGNCRYGIALDERDLRKAHSKNSGLPFTYEGVAVK